MLTTYDPLHAPDPQQWMALDEGKRIDLVRRYHQRARLKMPNVRVHADAPGVPRGCMKRPHGLATSPHPRPLSRSGRGEQSSLPVQPICERPRKVPPGSEGKSVLMQEHREGYTA